MCSFSKGLKKKKKLKTLWLELLQGGSLLFTSKFPEIPGTQFIDLRNMKG